MVGLIVIYAIIIQSYKKMYLKKIKNGYDSCYVNIYLDEFEINCYNIFD